MPAIGKMTAVWAYPGRLNVSWFTSPARTAMWRRAQCETRIDRAPEFRVGRLCRIFVAREWRLGDERGRFLATCRLDMTFPERPRRL